MTLRHRARLRPIAAGSVLGLTAGTVAVLGAATPAAAGSYTYTCTVLGSPQPFAVSVDTTAPATLATGSSTAPDVTATVTIPSGLVDAVRTLFGAEQVAGTIQAHALVDGADVPATLTVPVTAVPASGDLPLVATGALPPIAGGDPGDVVEIATGALDVTMTMIDTTPPSPIETPFQIPCAPDAGQDTVVDTISVVKAASRTTVRADYLARRDKATGTAVVKSVNGIPVTGKVKLVLRKGTRKVAAVTKTLRSGRATAAFTGVRKRGSYTLAATYLGDARVKSSSGRDTFRVR